MESRLDAFTDWESAARSVRYVVKRLAKERGVSPRQLQRFIHERFGLPAKLWMEQLRIRHSIALLRQGKLVKEVATEAGFANETHFSRAFKQQVGVSPRKFTHAGESAAGCRPDVRKWFEMSAFGSAFDSCSIDG